MTPTFYVGIDEFGVLDLHPFFWDMQYFSREGRIVVGTKAFILGSGRVAGWLCISTEVLLPCL